MRNAHPIFAVHVVLVILSEAKNPSDTSRHLTDLSAKALNPVSLTRLNPMHQ
jgi:hypothetical protein